VRRGARSAASELRFDRAGARVSPGRSRFTCDITKHKCIALRRFLERRINPPVIDILGGSKRPRLVAETPPADQRALLTLVDALLDTHRRTRPTTAGKAG
jgi:hypothetical protein